MKKYRILTGLQPTGDLHIGNYLGSVRELIWAANKSSDTETFLFIPDLHAITVDHNPKQLRENIKKLLATYLACGVDPAKYTIYLQSDIEVIPAISWILETQTPFGELSRMTQFKDKSAKNELFGAGLFSYPSLMAADILAMDADYVPVGKDQKQHLEFARNTAERMNKKYGKLFIVPQELINENTAKIYDLLDPTKKMSKSDETLNGVIMLSDDEKTVRKKISRAVTDSDAKVKFDPKKKPGVSNLLSIYAGFKNITPVEAAKTFKNSNYGELKNAVADAVWAKLSEIQTNYAAIILNGSLDQILEAGKQKAERLARMKYAQMREALGLRI